MANQHLDLPNFKEFIMTKPIKATTKDKPAKAVIPNLSQKQVMALFGITHMTAYNWRTKEINGRPTMPCVKDGNQLKFPANKIITWADKHEVPMALTLDKVMKLGLENKTSGRPAKAKTA